MARPTTQWLGLIPALLVACSVDDQARWIDLPGASGANTLVLADTRAAEVRLYAVDLNSPGDFHLDLEVAQAFSGAPAQAALYSQTLAELELNPGPQTGPEGAALGTLRGSPLGLYELSPLESKWNPIAELLPQVVSAQVNLANPCARYEQPVWVENRDPMRTRFGLRISDSEGLVGAYSEASQQDVLFLAGPGGMSEIVSPFANARVRSGFRDRDGAVWLGATDGSVAQATRGGPGVTLGPIVRSPNGHAIDRIDGGRTQGGEHELVVLSDGAVSFYAGSSWSPPVALPSSGRLMWLGPGKALVSSEAQAGVLFSVDRSGFSTQALGEGGGMIHCLRLVPGVGALAGTEFGTFFVQEQDSWRPLDPEHTESVGWFVVSIEPPIKPDRFMFLMSSGFMSLYRKDRALDLCPTLPVVAIMIEGFLVPMANEDLLVGGYNGSRVEVRYYHPAQG